MLTFTLCKVPGFELEPWNSSARFGHLRDFPGSVHDLAVFGASACIGLRGVGIPSKISEVGSHPTASSHVKPRSPCRSGPMAFPLHVTHYIN